MKSETRNSKSKIIIVGAGPAGASLAIRLAKESFDVCLIEREKFPRQKLCGEFISPECLRHFEAFGVLEAMLAAGGEPITKTVFYEPRGKSISVPSKWFGTEIQNALSLSRAATDFHLLKKAGETGAEVLEETQVVGLLIENLKVCGVKIRTKDGQTKEIFADLTVDATGRAKILTKLAAREFSRQKRETQKKNNSKSAPVRNLKSKIQNSFVGFKTHLQNASVEKGVCEIYFFRGGYGGLSEVENNLANHCFLLRADLVKKYGDAQRIVEKVVFQNRRAFQTMKNATPVFDWIAVSVDNFGANDLNPAKNLFTVGDAAAFIDPFTGSGMLMALESAQILAKLFSENVSASEKIANNYKILHNEKFQKRLRICSIMRQAAFVPKLAGFAISALNLSENARRILARSTRSALSAAENKQ